MTLPGSIPSARATSARADCGFCVDAHTSQPEASTRATAAGGSMAACARCGTWYSASMRRAAAASARSTSPTLRATSPGARTAAVSASR